MTVDLAVGDALPVLTKTIYQRALARRTFSDDSIHNDDHTRKHGYPGALVSAYVLTGYMSEPMVTFFGASWFTTGKISLTFIGRGVQQGDPVAIHATVTGIDDTPQGRHVHFDLEMQKQGGTPVVVGEASGILRPERT